MLRLSSPDNIWLTHEISIKPARPHASDAPRGNPPVPSPYPRGNICAFRNAYGGTMTKKLVFVTTILLVAALGLWAADVSGKWTWEQQGRGGNTATVTLMLKQDGSKLSGSISQPGRGGNPMEAQISDATIEGDAIAFKVSRETQNGTFTTTYKGTVKGDTIDMEITRPAYGGGEAPPPLKVTAKKSGT